MTNTPYHFATFNREEVIILGYRKLFNNVMIIRVNGLPLTEQQELRRIASSPVAQKTDYLVKVLESVQHPSGENWWKHLVVHYRKHGGMILEIALKELEDMNEDQKAFFKGYGKSATLGGTVPAPETRTTTQDIPSSVLVDEDFPLEPETPVNQIASASPSNDAILSLLSQLVESQNRLAAGQDNLAKAILKNNSSAPARKKPGPKPKKKVEAKPEGVPQSV